MTLLENRVTFSKNLILQEVPDPYINDRYFYNLNLISDIAYAELVRNLRIMRPLVYLSILPYSYHFPSLARAWDQVVLSSYLKLLHQVFLSDYLSLVAVHQAASGGCEPRFNKASLRRPKIIISDRLSL